MKDSFFDAAAEIFQIYTDKMPLLDPLLREEVSDNIDITDLKIATTHIFGGQVGKHLKGIAFPATSRAEDFNHFMNTEGENNKQMLADYGIADEEAKNFIMERAAKSTKIPDPGEAAMEMYDLLKSAGASPQESTNFIQMTELAALRTIRKAYLQETRFLTDEIQERVEQYDVAHDAEIPSNAEHATEIKQRYLGGNKNQRTGTLKNYEVFSTLHAK